MSWIEAIILGIVQGATEFLPISSTAHLRVVPELFGWPDPQAAFSAVIQCGTLVAVIIYFRHDLRQIATAWFRDLLAGTPLRSAAAREGWMILLGTLPIVVVGLLLKKHIESSFRSLYVVAGALIGFGAVMLAAEAFAWWRRSRTPPREMDQLHAGDAAAMGLAQALALVPGVSRSGATISAGLVAGLSREAAARFSFLLSLPAIFAAAVFELIKARKELLGTADDAGKLLLATIVAGLVGYAAIAWLLAYVRQHTTAVFVFYRWLVAGLLLWWLAAGQPALINTSPVEPHGSASAPDPAAAHPPVAHSPVRRSAVNGPTVTCSSAG
ncbi:MAG TPA: undecaprenyl-diphosphatase UppP [Pirellulales bacterium]|nr:undecaprenyl-diphosphatase UppP [Pirellulales bacterium]